jgi:hypothetical protein
VRVNTQHIMRPQHQDDGKICDGNPAMSHDEERGMQTKDAKEAKGGKNIAGGGF